MIGHSLARLPTVQWSGLAVVTAAAAWRQSATEADVETLIMLGDALVGAPRDQGRSVAPVTTIEELTLELESAAGSRGASAARRALVMVRSGVGSPMETRLRLSLLRSGLPEPIVDHPVSVEPGRVWHPDLAYPEARIAIEYEGDGHSADRDRWRRDIARREAFEDAGWRVVRVTAADLGDPAPLALRVRRLLAARADLQL